MMSLFQATSLAQHKAAHHSVPEQHRDNAPEPRQRTTGQVVGLPLRGVRVFTCACGKVQAGRFLGSSRFPSKLRCLIRPPAGDAIRWAGA